MLFSEVNGAMVTFWKGEQTQHIVSNGDGTYKLTIQNEDEGWASTFDRTAEQLCAEYSAQIGDDLGEWATAEAGLERLDPNAIYVNKYVDSKHWTQATEWPTSRDYLWVLRNKEVKALRESPELAEVFGRFDEPELLCPSKWRRPYVSKLHIATTEQVLAWSRTNDMFACEHLMTNWSNQFAARYKVKEFEKMDSLIRDLSSDTGATYMGNGLWWTTPGLI